jgi:hypothetical protein
VVVLVGRYIALVPTNHHRIQPTKDSETKRQALLKALAYNFRKPKAAPWDRETMRDGKHRAWPIR